MFQNLSTFERISILPEFSLNSNVEIAILVITRWNDHGSRIFLRNTLGFTNKWTPNQTFQKNKKLLFVFGIPKNVSLSEMNQLRDENTVYQDMIIPGKFSVFQDKTTLKIDRSVIDWGYSYHIILFAIW